jgi:hypothetical protein
MRCFFRLPAIESRKLPFLFSECNVSDKTKLIPQLQPITFDKNKDPMMLLPMSSNQPLPYMTFYDEKSSHAPELCDLFNEFIIDHLEDLDFVGSNNEGLEVDTFVQQGLWHWTDKVELIKFIGDPIQIGDIDLLLSDSQWMNDQIINAVAFMTNVSL